MKNWWISNDRGNSQVICAASRQSHERSLHDWPGFHPKRRPKLVQCLGATLCWQERFQYIE